MAQESSTGLERRLGLLGLAATGICSMLGAAINIVPFMLQRNVPGIGPYVLPAYLFAAVPALLAAMADRDTYAKAFIQVGNLWQKGPAARRFTFSRRLAGIAAALLGTAGTVDDRDLRA